MTVWETDDEYAADATRSLSSPNSTTSTQLPIHNKPQSTSQNSDTKGMIYSDNYCSNDGMPPMFDPLQITSTIHANLVSEILSLRRTQEAKKSEIESLELTLYETKKEQDAFSAELATISKENFSLKRKLKLIESETTSAISEITRERDSAVEAASEVKRRLEVAQKKNRTQDCEIDRTHTLWARDKTTWEEEKRMMERRVHVAETRLKRVLDEVVAHEANQIESQQCDKHVDYEQGISQKEESDNESAATRSRPNSVRSSMLSGLMGLSNCELKGLSLAEELDLDGIIDDEEEDGSATSKNYETPRLGTPVFSSQLDNCGNISKGTSDQSVQTIGTTINVVERGTQANTNELDEVINGIVSMNVVVPGYIDTGIQCSPPSSPKSQLSRLKDALLPPVKIIKNDHVLKRIKSWPAASQQLLDLQDKPAIKDTHLNSSSLILSFNPNPQSVFKSYDMAVTSSSSISHLSEEVQESITNMVPTEKIDKMKSVSTQTDQFPPSLNRNAPHPIVIPSIQLFPPLSSAKSSAVNLLSPHLRDVGCQVVIESVSAMKSVAVQTDNAIAHKKLHIWTSQFQSSAISSSLPSPAIDIHRSPSILLRKSQSNGSLVKLRTAKCSPIKQTIHEVQPQPMGTSKVPKNQCPNKPLQKINRAPVPYHINTSFSDGDISSEEDPGTEMTNYSSFHTPLSVPKARKTVLYEEEIYDLQKDKHTVNIRSKEKLGEADHQGQKSPVKSTNEHLEKEKYGLKSSFDTQHLSDTDNRQDRHASSPLPTVEPPFPIPTRNSSWRPNISPSMTSDNLEFPTWNQGGLECLRNRSLRKVRSAATLSTTMQNISNESVYEVSPSQNTRSIGSSPPATIHSIESSPNPYVPPVSKNHITTLADKRERHSLSRAASINSDSIRIDSITSSRTSIVSAIAEAMIGEWLYKYTRYKSRGAHDLSMDIDNPSGSRHRRWVWVAPYEREVIWSSRQPTSDSALMGKGGRKLMIQSVLDVKDDNPVPKNICLHHRSILILTPVRALKITTTSAERHQTWMMALSFLAHSKRMNFSHIPAVVDTPDTKAQSRSSRRKFNIHGNKSKQNTPPKSAAASKKYSQSVADNSPPFTARNSNVSENINPAADAPIVPRLSHRSVTNFTTSSSINYLIPNYAQPTNTPSCHGSNTINNRGNSRQMGYNCTTASALAAASTLGLSVAASENSDIYAYNARPILQTTVRTNNTNPCPLFSISQGNYKNKNSVDTESPLNYNPFETAGTVCMQAFVNPRSSTDAYAECQSRKSSLVDDELDQEELGEWYGNENQQDAKKKWHGQYDKDAYMCFDETRIITDRSLEDRCAFPRDDEVDLFHDF